MRKLYLLLLLFSLSFAAVAQQRAFIAFSQTNIYQRPSVRSPVLLRLPKGTALTVYRQPGLQVWRKVSYGRVSGYILKRHLNFGSGELSAYGAVVRCEATTRSGLQCKRRTRNQSRLCTQHGGKKRRTTHTYSTSKPATQSVHRAQQCRATTRKGSRCRRRTKSMNGYCWQHD